MAKSIFSEKDSQEIPNLNDDIIFRPSSHFYIICTIPARVIRAIREIRDAENRYSCGSCNTSIF